MKTHGSYILNITLLNVLIRFLLFQMYTKNAKTMLLKWVKRMQLQIFCCAAEAELRKGLFYTLADEVLAGWIQAFDFFVGIIMF